MHIPTVNDSFHEQDGVWVERTIDGMINIKATFAAVLHSSLHFDVFKLASDLCWIPYVLCVCYQLSLTLDGFINDLYKQATF